MEINVKKLGTTVTVPSRHDAPEATLDHMWAFAWSEKFNNCLAGVKRPDYPTDEAFLVVAGKKVADIRDNLAAGKVPGTRDTGATVTRKAVEYVKTLSDAEFAEVLAAFEAARATVEKPAAE